MAASTRRANQFGVEVGKRLVAASAIVIALVAIGYLLQRYILGEPPSSTTAPSGTEALEAGVDAANPELVAMVLSVAGTVERHGADGQWTALQEGQQLAPDDVIRTAADGRASLDLGGRATVEVAEHTEFHIGQVSKTLSRIQLDDGRIASVVQRGEGFRFRVEVRGGGAAESEEGKFHVVRRGEGPVAVAAETGTVRVSAEGEQVEVTAGKLSLIPRGGAPTPATNIPGSLFLKLGEPAKVAGNHAELKGRTAQGAIVSINGVRTSVDRNGEFSGAVVLDDGANEITIVVEDVLGRRMQKKLPKIAVVDRPSEPPPQQDAGLEAKVVW